MRGRFITIEGGEGAGKSTMMSVWPTGWKQQDTGWSGPVSRAARIWLKSCGRSCWTGNNISLSGQAELLLVFAARAQHLDELIRPALARGDWVLCDRFTDATWAYQGGGRGLPRDDIATLENLVHGDLQPDLTLLLDLPVEQGMKRAASAARRIASNRNRRCSLSRCVTPTWNVRGRARNGLP